MMPFPVPRIYVRDKEEQGRFQTPSLPTPLGRHGQAGNVPADLPILVLPPALPASLFCLGHCAYLHIRFRHDYSTAPKQNAITDPVEGFAQQLPPGSQGFAALSFCQKSTQWMFRVGRCCFTSGSHPARFPFEIFKQKW